MPSHNEMKERQRWRSEEDNVLRSYVKQFGPREWHLVSQRMNVPLDRDAKSCLERWKNYLKPGIKKGSLTEEEQRHVIRLQAKHGNKWKKIASEVPGRTAKRLGKWWEVFKEKQQRENKEIDKSLEPIEDGKYDQILETFAEKLVKEHPTPALFMANSNCNFPTWLSKPNSLDSIRPVRPMSPSVTLSLSPTMQMDSNSNSISNNPPVSGNFAISEIWERWRELEEGHRAWASHKKEAAWRLRRVELQLDSEKAVRRREKMDEIENKMKALRDEERVCLDRIEAEYRDQLSGMKREAEAKEHKLAEQWAAKHSNLTKFLHPNRR